MIRHIRFVPSKMKGAEEVEIPDADEIERRKERLRSLGYL